MFLERFFFFVIKLHYWKCSKNTFMCLVRCKINKWVIHISQLNQHTKQLNLGKPNQFHQQTQSDQHKLGWIHSKPPSCHQFAPIANPTTPSCQFLTSISTLITTDNLEFCLPSHHHWLPHAKNSTNEDLPLLHVHVPNISYSLYLFVGKIFHKPGLTFTRYCFLEIFITICFSKWGMRKI